MIGQSANSPSRERNGAVPEFVLGEAVRDLVAEIRAATADFEASAERVQSLAGAALAGEVNRLSNESQRQSQRRAGSDGWWFAVRCLCTGAILALLFVLVSQSQLQKPAP